MVTNMASSNNQQNSLPPMSPIPIPIEPPFVGPPSPSTETLLSSDNPSVFVKDTTRQLPLKLESQYALTDFYVFCRSLLNVPSNIPMDDVVNACLLEGVSMVFNYDPFNRKVRSPIELIFKQDPLPMFAFQRDIAGLYSSSQRSFIKKETNVYRQNSNGFVLDVGLLAQLATLIYGDSFEDGVRNIYLTNIEKGVKTNVLQFDQIAKQFINNTLLPNYFNFSTHPELREALLKKYPTIADDCLDIIRLAAHIAQYGASSSRSLSQFIGFICQLDNLYDLKVHTIKDVFFKSLRELTDANIFTIPIGEIDEQDVEWFDDFRIIFKIYCADIPLFEIIEMLKPSVDILVRDPKLNKITSKEEYQISPQQVCGSINILYLLAMIEKCGQYLDARGDFFFSKANPNTSFFDFLRSIPALNISYLPKDDFDKYLREILKKFDIMAWSDVYQAKSAGNLIGLEFIGDKIEKSVVLNEYACSFGNLISNLNLFDNYFILPMLSENPDLTNMDVLKAIYKNITKKQNSMALREADEFLFDQTVDACSLASQTSADRKVDYTKLNKISTSALDMIFFATMYVMQQYALANCKIFQDPTDVKVLKANEVSQGTLLLAEVKTKLSNAALGKILIASSIYFITLKIMSSRR